MRSDKGEPSPKAASSIAGKLIKSALVSQGLMAMVSGEGRGGAARIRRLYSSVCGVPKGQRSMVRVSASLNPYLRKRLRLMEVA